MSTDPSPLVVAAGGVVLDVSDGERLVLVVHRPAHDDWSLPKGHVDGGETLAGAALREVEEETGVAATVVADAGTTQHPVVTAGRHATKQVHWFVMRPLAGSDPAARPPDAEVDEARWWPVAAALVDLTYAGERELLARALTLLPSGSA